MNDKIIIPFDGKSKSDIDSGGVFTFIGFERLRRLLVSAELDDTEIISGFMIDETGVSIRIDKKPIT